MKNFARILLAVGAAALLFSCATKADVYQEIDEAVSSAAYENALNAIDAAQTPPEGKGKAKNPIYPEKNVVLLYLDKGILEHYAEKYPESAQDLIEAERLIEEAYTKSITQDLGSYFANDNTKDYPGEDYEDIYTDVFNALNFYHQDNPESAMVEIRQVIQKLQVLADKYVPKEDSKVKPELITAFVLDAVGITAKVAGLDGFLVPIPEEILNPDPPATQFTDSALAEYLSLIFYRGDGREDDARIAHEAIAAVYSASPNVYSGGVPASLAEELSVPAGKARLNFISFTGRAPVKEQKIIDLDLDFFPTISALKPLDNPKLRLTTGNMAVPALLAQPSSIESVTVEVNGERVTLDLLEDIGKVVEETFLVKFPSIRTKAYIRAILKYVTVEVAAQVARKNANGNDLLVVAAATGAKKAADASEQADIRASRYLPGKAFVGGINLDPGTYDVTFTFSNGETVTKSVTAAAGKANLVEAVSLK
jgi:hypothetical protein